MSSRCALYESLAVVMDESTLEMTDLSCDGKVLVIVEEVVLSCISCAIIPLSELTVACNVVIWFFNWFITRIKGFLLLLISSVVFYCDDTVTSGFGSVCSGSVSAG